MVLRYMVQWVAIFFYKIKITIMNKQQLANKIWASANKMRSKIEANEYKDYILGFIFYKFLSEQEVRLAKENDFTDADLPQLKEEDQDIVQWAQNKLGYFIASTLC